MKLMYEIGKYKGAALWGNINSDIDRVILPCILFQPCNKCASHTSTRTIAVTFLHELSLTCQFDNSFDEIDSFLFHSLLHGIGFKHAYDN